MSKHTEGPWVVDSETYLGDTDDRYHSITAGCGYHCDDDDDGFEITGCISTANAHLIAAAPELLEALEKAATYIEALESYYGKNLEVMGWHQNGDPVPLDKLFEDNSNGDELELARAAIAKAKGERV